MSSFVLIWPETQQTPPEVKHFIKGSQKPQVLLPFSGETPAGRVSHPILPLRSVVFQPQLPPGSPELWL